MLPRCCGALQHFAFAAIEAAKLGAPTQRHPHDALAIDLDSLGVEPFHARSFGVIERWLVDFRSASLRGMRTERVANNFARHRSLGASVHTAHSPKTTIDGARA